MVGSGPGVGGWKAGMSGPLGPAGPDGPPSNIKEKQDETNEAAVTWQQAYQTLPHDHLPQTDWRFYDNVPIYFSALRPPGQTSCHSLENKIIQVADSRFFCQKLHEKEKKNIGLNRGARHRKPWPHEWNTNLKVLMLHSVTAGNGIWSV